MQYFDNSFVFGDNVYIDDYYMDELWAIIPGFDDYLVSNKGRVWSLKSRWFLTIKPMDDHGHMGVCLCKNGIRYYRYIHRLVAEAFIPNPHNHPIVRHIMDDPSQNDHTELAWGTMKDNARDCARNGHAYIISAEDRYRGYKDRMTPIIAQDLNTGEELYFESQTEASRCLNIPQANIWKVLNGERRTAGGYMFRRDRSE